MHAVVRRYSGTGASALMDVLASNTADIQRLIEGVTGFVSYSLIRTADGGISVTVCQDKAGADDSVQKAKDWIAKVRDPEYKAVVERVYVIRVEAFDWNCQQHIIPRYTAEEIREALVPAEKRMQELEQENEKLREELTQANKKNHSH